MIPAVSNTEYDEVYIFIPGTWAENNSVWSKTVFLCSLSRKTKSTEECVPTAQRNPADSEEMRCVLRVYYS